jgi:hypothetical protein
MGISKWIKPVVILISIIALLVAIWAGWIRLGWPFPYAQPTLPFAHGPLMISAFLGTLISLERAVAINKPWMYLAPLLSGLAAFCPNIRYRIRSYCPVLVLPKQYYISLDIHPDYPPTLSNPHNRYGSWFTGMDDWKFTMVEFLALPQISALVGSIPGANNCGRAA